MAGESDARRKKILKDLTKRSYTLKELVERYSASESSIKHDIIELRKQGYEIPGGGKKGYRLVSSVSGDTEAPVFYESLRKDKLSKLMLLLILQREKKPLTEKELVDLYYASSDSGRVDRTEEGQKGIRERVIRTLIPGLLSEKMIRKTEDRRYVISDHAPICLPLRMDDAFDILDQLHYFGPAHPFAGQLRNVEEKLSAALIDDKNPRADETYQMLGKKDVRSAGVQEFLAKLGEISLREHKVKIVYVQRDGERRTMGLYPGLILYATDKNTLYLIGKPDEETREAVNPEVEGDVSDYILICDRIEEIIELPERNPWFQAPYYLAMYEEMFSISVDPVQHVEVEFDNLFNIRTKLERMMKQRKRARLKDRGDKLVYEDDIRGLRDFARYLRQYGRAARVKAPQELCELMVFSTRLLLERYKEVTT